MPAVIWLVPRMKYRLAVSGLLLSTPTSIFSSESSFLVRLLPLLLLPPRRILPFSPSADSPRRSRRAKTFSAAAIVGLLIALGFPPSSTAFFPSYLNLSFSPLHFFLPHLLVFSVCLLSKLKFTLRDFHLPHSHLSPPFPSSRPQKYIYSRITRYF